MKKNLLVEIFCLFLLFFSPHMIFSQNSSSQIPEGYGGIKLGMNLEQTKRALKNNIDFGYHGDRDVSLLPGENRVLIETDAGKDFSFLERCWFQFYNDKLYTITININQEKMDHYSVFSELCKKYGNPKSVSPEKSVWENDSVTMSLERPLTLKYVDKKTFNELQGNSRVGPSATEMTREMFLEGL